MLAWRISERPGFTRVELQGEIDDGVDLAALARRLAGPVRLHLGEVRQVSPLGLRGWLAFENLYRLSALYPAAVLGIATWLIVSGAKKWALG